MAKESSRVSVNFGGIGAACAAGLSYAKWHSFWLAFGHLFLGWIYVVYHLCVYGLPVIHRY
jgi:hypothetical protein